MRFNDRLKAAQVASGSMLCVGLDVDPRRLPDGISADRKGIERFVQGIVTATADLVCAYKPNLAFFEALGDEGALTLKAALACIPSGVITIGDGKRGDIGTTAERYAAALFEYFGFDSATTNPYQGIDSIEPYLADESRGAFILCKTSNPGSDDFQDLLCQDGEGSAAPLYEIVARKAVTWNTRGNVGLVVGATFPEQLARVREVALDLPFLIPGVGTQGGDAAESVRLGTRAGGVAVINVSRQVLFASSGADWMEAARREATSLRDAMRQANR